MKSVVLKQMLAAIALLAALTLAISTALANPIAYPPINVQSPQNKIYSSTEIELTFAHHEPSFFTSFSYCLDGGLEVSIDGNTTITGLSWGSHSLVVYARDSGGYTWFSQPVYFDVFLSSVWFVMPILAVAVLVFLGFLVYLVRRKQSQ